MPECPNCRAENAPGTRFCAECGVRIDQTPPAAQDQPAPPAQTTGKETIVLRASDLAPTERLPDQAPPATPFTDATIVAGPAVPSAPPAADKTIAAGPAAVAGGETSSSPTTAFPTPGQAPTPPGALPASQPPAQSGGRIWLVIGLVLLLGLGMICTLVAGVVLFTRTTGSTATTPTSEAGGGLARLPTAGARPTAPPKPTAKPKPTAIPEPTAVPKPTAGASGQGVVLIEDDFDDPTSSALTEETSDTATYTFVDGTYAISVKEPQYIVWSSYDGSHGDIDIAVDTTLDEGPLESAAGVLFRYQDEDNFYYYRISADGSYSLVLYKAGERQVLIDWTESQAIKGRKQVNHLRVEAVGDRIRMFVNDEQLAEVSDDTFAKGEVALAVSTFENGGATFKFDNLLVRGRS